MRYIVLFLCLFLCPATALAQPSIVFDEETRDFGKIIAGSPIEHVFEVRNGGDQDLIITRLVPS